MKKNIGLFILFFMFCFGCAPVTKINTVQGPKRLDWYSIPGDEEIRQVLPQLVKDVWGGNSDISNNFF